MQYAFSTENIKKILFIQIQNLKIMKQELYSYKNTKTSSSPLIQL